MSTWLSKSRRLKSNFSESLEVSRITTYQVVDPIQAAREQELLEANRVLHARVLLLEGQLETSKRNHDRELHQRDVELDRAREDFVQASSVSLVFISKLKFSFLNIFLFFIRSRDHRLDHRRSALRKSRPSDAFNPVYIAITDQDLPLAPPWQFA